ncbi:MAG: hypothetical protein ACLU0O_04495 [Collinsella sp.]
MKRADLYIFDDSFSALDFKTDAALRHALQTRRVTLRCSSSRSASRLFCMPTRSLCSRTARSWAWHAWRAYGNLRGVPRYRGIADEGR